jgi:S1-C subfamily serine protease
MRANRQTLLILWFASALAPVPSALFADTVTLKDGTKLDGIITIQTATKLVLERGGSTRVIRLDDVTSIARTDHPVPPPVYTPPRGAQAPAGFQFAPLRPTPSDMIPNSTVKISATVSRPDIRKPWAKLAPRDETGSGFVIPGKRILTNAHFVEYASDIQISGNETDTKFSAQVVAIDTTLDLAVLRLDDESFFNTHQPFSPVAETPNTRFPLLIYGYSVDSASVTISKPSVTTVDYEPYTAEVSGLIARLNSGFPDSMSGGPVSDGTQVIGIACSRKFGSQTFCYVLPAGEFRPFLEAAANGYHHGVPMLYDQTQALENPALREYLGMDASQHGAVVTSSFRKDDGSLLDWDVITKVLGDDVDDQGTVSIGPFNRVNFAYQYQTLFRVPPSELPVEDYHISVVRKGVQRDVFAELVRNRRMLIPDLMGAPPSYFVFGPIVFSAVSSEVTSFISTSGLEVLLAVRGSPLVKRKSAQPDFEGEQLVFVPSSFLPHRLAQGYSDPTFTVVKAVNGIPIRNLNHLVKVLRDSRDEFITIEFFEKDTEVLVFPRAEMIAATDGILSDNNVRNQGSTDTMAIWNAR